jgi:hypothetical protein
MFDTKSEMLRTFFGIPVGWILIQLHLTTYVKASTELCILLVSLLWLVGKQTCILGPLLSGNYRSLLPATTAVRVGNQLSTVHSCVKHTTETGSW